MGIQLNTNTPNQVLKGTIIFSENEQIDGVCLLIKGKILMQNKGVKLVLSQGSFIGISDLELGRYTATYIAVEECVVYAYDVNDMGNIENILSLGKDYGGLTMISNNKYIVETSKIYDELIKISDKIYEVIIDKYNKFKKISTQYGQKADDTPGAKEFKKLFVDEINQYKLEYYRNISKIPVDIQKQFYGLSTYVCKYHLEDQNELINEIITACKDMSNYVIEGFNILIGDNLNNMFKNYSKIAMDISKVGGNNADIINEIDDIVEVVNKVEKFFVEKVGQEISADRNKMEEIYCSLISGVVEEEDSTTLQVDYTKDQLAEAEDELKDSLEKILAYSGISETKATEMRQLVNAFKIMTDKFIVDNDTRKIRKRISDIFFELYELIFIKATESNDKSRLIDMFLKYGYIDENLLQKEQLMELYYLKEYPNTGRCKAYNIREWLLEIYEGRVEPSKNEFDMDYTESLREMRKTVKMSETEQKEYLADTKKKLSFEINNMFRINTKLTNGQISSFVPILFQEMFVKSIKKSYVDALMINETIDKLLSIDYSIFYREVLFVDDSKGIEKERIMKQVMPDIILMPTCGTNGVMWQETATKRKDTKARFTLPLFTSVSLEDLFINIFARYRWEICRSIQGLAWNDIRERSLTSEYADYIQFYRKNRDVTEQMKEKIKLQIQRGRNNLKEIFAIDYEAWIKSESQGGIRLNKVVRSILYLYCPFSRPIREKLQAQPIFAEVANKFNALNLKKVKEIENHYVSLKKNNVDICEELVENLKYYKEL